MTKKILTLDNIPVIKKKIGRIDTIEKLKASTIYSLGDVVEVLGFHAKGDGSHHKRVAKSADDGSGELGQNGIWWCIVHDGEVNVSWFGAKGDGITDDTTEIQKALDFSENIVVGVSTKNVYNISETLLIKPDTKVEFVGNLKIIHETTYDCAIMPMHGAWGVRIINPLIDCGNIPAQGGIYLRRNVTDTSIIGGHIKNARHDKGGRGGGRGINVEAGVNPSENGNRNSLVDGVKFTNCFVPYSFQGGDTLQQNTNNIVSNLIIEDCEFLFEFFCNDGNSSGVSAKGSSLVISNITARNIVNKTFTRKLGLICGDRASNVIGRNIAVVNDDVYSVFDGDFYDCDFEVSVFSNTVSYVNIFRGFFEGETINDAFKTDNSTFKVEIIGTLNNIALSTKAGESKVSNSCLNIKAKNFSGTTLLPSNLTTNITSYLEVDFRNIKSRVRGYFNKGVSLRSNVNNISGLNLTAGRFTSTPTGLTVGDLYVDGSSFVKMYTETSTLSTLDTPYYAYKMQQEGIYEDYVTYRDELFEYENSQTSDEAMLLPVLHEPVIPESIKQFAEKYKLI